MIDQNPKAAEVLDDQVSILDLMVVLAKRKRWIIGSAALCAAIGLVIALLLPPVYTAKAKILPPQQSQGAGMGAMLGQLGAMSGMAAGMAGIKSPDDLYVGMLQSQTVADDLINRFKLKDRYKVKLNIDASNRLKGETKITSGKDGFITVEFSDQNPTFAAQVANAYVNELKKLTGNLSVTEASQRRLFFEKQLKLAKEQLDDAEERFKELQEQSGVLTLDSQVKASIAELSQLKAALAGKEIELQSMQTFATPENPDFQRLRSEVAELKAQMERAQTKSGDGMVATQKLPAAGLEYARRLRDQKFAETVYELMLKQYEVAKVDEAKDTSVVQQLDQAQPPERRSKPKRAQIVTVSLILGIVLGVLAAFVREACERIDDDPVKRDKWRDLMMFLKSV